MGPTSDYSDERSYDIPDFLQIEKVITDGMATGRNGSESGSYPYNGST